MHSSCAFDIDLAIAPAAEVGMRPGALDDLDAAERARLARLRHPADRLRFVAGRALLRELVSRRAGIPAGEVRFRVDARGRLHVEIPGVDVGIAHAAGAVVVAVSSGGRVGIDLEPATGVRDLESLALTPAERRAVATLPADRRVDRVLEAWTVKEAYAKLTGHGLCLDFTRLALERIASRPRVALRTFVAPVAGRHYRISLAGWAADLAVAADPSVRIALAADAPRSAAVAA